MRKLLIPLALAATLTGCASGGMGTMDKIMASWEGANLDEVIKQWGYPHEERTVGGHHLVVWQRSVQLSMPATSNTSGTLNQVGSTGYYQGTTTTYGGGMSNWNCTRILEVNAANTVVSWQWEGNNCPFMEAGPYSSWRRKN